VAAIAGLRSRVNYEGQAAMELEMAARDETEAFYDYAWEGDRPIRILPRRSSAACWPISTGYFVSTISVKFHNTLIRLFDDLCDRVRRERDLNRSCLAAGCSRTPGF